MLTKISNSLKSKDLRIGLLELLILVVGLFMGFQLDRWNEERLRQQDAQDYIGQSRGDRS